ncbi:hypothetical protein N7G274_008260 [Stereocaulon virgatum]|uniref:carnosine N-methyltransferase n=1 Tax=Stereocaulon virgatum TaxID=373712 RepID=A0ABR4A0D1_9LECA
MEDLRDQSQEWGLEYNHLADPDEKRVLFAAFDSFRQYRKTAHYNVTHRRRQNFYALSTSQWQMLSAPPFNLLANFERVDAAIDANADIASAMLASGLRAFDVKNSDFEGAATPTDMDKAKSTIRQFYRDWSAEGDAERRACYNPVLRDLESAFVNVQDKSSVKVLVPGAGLGRLVFEVCRRGYVVEGNEISFHQLIASNWVLNHTIQGQSLALYPFALDFSNLISREHQLQKVKIPDVHPASALKGIIEDSANGVDRMTMTAADFVILYSEDRYKNTFDAVVTVFFIDTAPNLIRYIETIHNCLKTGGVWINLGPLLWHFADRGPAIRDEHNTVTPKAMSGIEEPGSFELTDEEVLMLVEEMGFDVQSHEIRTDGLGYIQNPNSMLQNAYSNSHWIAKKRP